MNHEKFHKIIKFQQYFFKNFFCKKKNRNFFFNQKFQSKTEEISFFNFKIILRNNMFLLKKYS